VSEIIIHIKRVRPLEDHDLPLPEYKTPGSSGLDLRAAVTRTETIEPGQIKLIPTGVAIALPEGFEAQIRPRSGLALKKGLSLVNTPGTIDADYRGEIKAIMINLGSEPANIARGDRIAQMVIARTWRAELNLVDELETTIRGDGGFGHTDKDG